LLLSPPNLTGTGENGENMGAEVIYQTVNGVLTDEPLWPWPMEDRIIAESGYSVTYSEQPGGSSASEFIGLWKTLAGVYGDIYYVKDAAAGGLDSNDGLTDGTAWATIAKVKATVSAGDTVYFRSQDTWGNQPADLPVLSTAEGVTYDGSTYGTGTRAKFVTDMDQVGGSDRTAIIDIKYSNTTVRGFECDGAEYNIYGIWGGKDAPNGDIYNTHIDNCIVHSCGTPLENAYLYGIHLAGKTSNGCVIYDSLITNCIVHDCGHEGIAIYQSWSPAEDPTRYQGCWLDGLTIRNCETYNNGVGHVDGDGGIGILVANKSLNVTIEFCNIHDNGSDGIWMRQSPLSDGTADGAPQGLVIRHNVISNNRSGFTTQTGQSTYAFTAEIYNNLCYGNNDFAINVTSDEYVAGSDFKIYGNSVYHTGSQGPNATLYGAISVFPYSGSTLYPTVDVKNNVIVCDTRAAFSDSRGIATHANNQLFRLDGPTTTHVIDNGTSYNRADVLTWDATAQNTDPTFTGGTLPSGFTGTYGTDMVPNTNYFAIATGDAIDNGATLGAPYDQCINGAGLATPILRPSGAYDIGAYEDEP
jgi:hypothetical protein